jgi:hypothetical protein
MDTYARLGSNLYHSSNSAGILHIILIILIYIRTTCSFHLIHLDLINLIMSGDAYKSRNSHYAVFSSLLLLPPSII